MAAMKGRKLKKKYDIVDHSHSIFLRYIQ